MWNYFLSHTPLLYFTQSLWRDEAFSVLVAEKPIRFFFTNLGFEPPFYYTLLHFWIKIFGESEIATRGLSFLGVALATYIIIEWAGRLYKKHWLSWFVPLFFFLNPMILYYAFEVRTYGWYIFFATAAMYTYLEKKWRLYILASVLGFYTHSYFIFVPLTQGLHWLLLRGGWKTIRKGKAAFNDITLRSFLIIGIAVAPWIAKVIYESSKLKTSWYFPVNFNLIKSVLGNMFLGYEGTPWYMWKHTAILSGFLLFLFLLALVPRTSRAYAKYFLLAVFVPLALVIGISFRKPLFVNRYLISVTVAEVMLVGFALSAIRHKILQGLVAVLILGFVIWFNSWYPLQHAKLDIRTPLREINMLMSDNDVVYAESPLIFFESIYYSKNRNNVYLYNPNNSPFPWYVGDVIVSQKQMAYDLPIYPNRAFLIHENGTYDVVYGIRASHIPANPVSPVSL